LTVKPAVARVGAAVEIELDARAWRAPGAISYVLHYGDGVGTGSGAVPQFCIAGTVPPAHRTWRLEHRYQAAGRYVVSVSVRVNCTRDHATASTPVRVR
jgi:hypothetical protein